MKRSCTSRWGWKNTSFFVFLALQLTATLASTSASERDFATNPAPVRGRAALLPIAAPGETFAAAAVAEALSPLVRAWLVGVAGCGVAVLCNDEEMGSLVQTLGIPVQVLRPSAPTEQLAPNVGKLAPCVGLLACADDATDALERPMGDAGRVLMLLRRHPDASAASVLLRHLWHTRRLLQALLLTPPHVFEWDPFAPGDGLRVHPAPAPSFDPAAAFARRLRDLRGAPLVWGGYESGYTLVHQEGAEPFRGRNLQMLLAVAQVMRFTPTVRLPLYVESDAEEFRNRSVDVLLEDYAAHRMDVVINSFVVGRAEPGLFSYIVPLLDNIAVCTLVPLAKAVPLWMSPFLCFDVTAWMLTLVTYTAGAAAWRWGLREGRRMTPGGVVALLVSASVEPALRTRGDPQRLFLVIAMLFSLVTANAFQGALVNLITKRAFFPQIKTIEQLDRSGLPIVSTEALFKVLYGAELSSTYASLARRIRVQRHEEQRPSARAAYLVACKREAKWERYYDALYPQHMLLRELSNIWLQTLVLPRGSPFEDRLNAVVARVLEGGVWEKLDRDFFARWSSAAGRKPEPHDGPRAFSVASLDSAFYALLAGYVVSCAAFAVERFRAGGRHRPRLTSTPSSKGIDRGSKAPLRVWDYT